MFAVCFFICSLSLVLERHGEACGGDFIGEVRGRQMVEAVLRLRRWKYLDAHLHRSVLWIREWNVFFQVSDL